MTWLIASVFIAMVLQDVLGILMVQAEARNHSWMTAHFDTLQMFALLTTQTISITAMQGHSLNQKVLVIIAMTLGNYVGALTGVPLGKRFIKE